jgi:hypothetical protein
MSTLKERGLFTYMYSKWRKKKEGRRRRKKCNEEMGDKRRCVDGE